MLEKRKGIPSCKGYYLAKSGTKYHYDSMSELAMMMYLDKSDLSWQKNTKLRIPYVFEGKSRKYIPDFIILGNEYSPAIILEIKGSNDKPELPFKCEAAEKYCKEKSMFFELIAYDKVREMVNWEEVRAYHYAQVPLTKI